MTTQFSDGHQQSDAERRNDAATVAHLEAELAAPHGGRYAYGPFAGTPDNAQAARIERDDEESLWDAVIAAGPDCSDLAEDAERRDDDATGAA